ncbi:MAG: sigma 54-interacting transcriptional regulator [bacterium]
MDLVLTAWREVSRHLNIEESCARISGLLRDELDHATLIIRGLDIEHSRVFTLAIDVTNGDTLDRFHDPEPSEEKFKRLLSWCSRHETVQVSSGADHPAKMALPQGLGFLAIVGPLFDGSDVVGLAVFIARAGRAFSELAEERVASMLEPLTVAVRNDHQLHELQRLRDAMEADNQALLKRLGRQDITDAVIGGETGLKEVMNRVRQVSPTDVPVLLLGETGTGKEVVARLLHASSGRANGPMLRVNCGAIAPGLIDSELFGHEKGSFTGAVGDHKGWFERADGGTLFLDEIGELTPDVQVRLLLVLQDGVIQRVGGHSVVHVDVRVVAATHRDLWTMVAEGSFREDLWYRLSIFPIHLPPLRARKHDIPALAAHFASRAGVRHGGSPLHLTDNDILLLTEYDWPGNVRELNAVIERAAILGNGRVLHIAQALGSPGAVGRPAKEQQPSSEFLTLEAAERQHIESALRLRHGVIEGALGTAALLKINPHTLRSRMRKLGIDWKTFRGL